MNQAWGHLKAVDARRNMTAPEAQLWEFLGPAWIAQYPLCVIDNGALRAYRLDFFCEESLLGVEIDGDSHADSQAADEHRSALILDQHGIRIVRIPNAEVMKDPQYWHLFLDNYALERRNNVVDPAIANDCHLLDAAPKRLFPSLASLSERCPNIFQMRRDQLEASLSEEKMLLLELLELGPMLIRELKEAFEREGLDPTKVTQARSFLPEILYIPKRGGIYRLAVSAEAA